MSSSEEIPPDASDASTVGHKTIIFAIIIIIFQLAAVSMRFLSSRLNRLSWGGLDDILIMVSMIFQLGLASLAFDSVINGGVGHHLSYLTYNHPQKLERWFKDVYALDILYLLSINIPKLAILVLYHKLFIGNKTRITIYIIAAILVIYILILTPMTAFACLPVSTFWDITIAEPECLLNPNAIQIWAGFPNILTDLAMLVLPLPIIWKLNAGRSMKVGLSITFLLGSMGLITSIIRFIKLWSFTSESDRTRIAAEFLIFIQLEPAFYLICACLPRCRPLLDIIANSQLVRSLKGNSRGETSLNHGTSSFSLRPQNSESTRKLKIKGQIYAQPESLWDEARGGRILAIKEFEMGEGDIEAGKGFS